MKLNDNLSNIDRVAELLGLGPVAYDLVTSICGESMGAGCYRTVYEYNLDSRYVVKIEPLNTSCNLIEYMIWDEVKGLRGDLAWVKDWFAPCGWISPNGRIMTMRKTTDTGTGDNLPEKVPKFFWDVKWDNFGWIGKKFVCHDYGQFHNMINYPKGMVKANWYG